MKFRGGGGGGGYGRLNLDGELLPIRYSDFMFNLPKMYIGNACYVCVSSVGVFFANLFGFKTMGCFK